MDEMINFYYIFKIMTEYECSKNMFTFVCFVIFQVPSTNWLSLKKKKNFLLLKLHFQICKKNVGLKTGVKQFFISFLK